MRESGGYSGPADKDWDEIVMVVIIWLGGQAAIPRSIGGQIANRIG